MNKRPVILTILAILHVAGGALAFIAIPILVVVYQYKKEEAPENFSSIVFLLLVSILLLAILALVSGIGMLRRKKWGWWVGVLYSIYGIVRNVSALITMSGFGADFEEPPKGMEYYYFKHSFRVLVYALIVLYFFRGSVLEYFGLKQQSKTKAVIILFTIALIFWGGLAATQLI